VIVGKISSRAKHHAHPHQQEDEQKEGEKSHEKEQKDGTEDKEGESHDDKEDEEDDDEDINGIFDDEAIPETIYEFLPDYKSKVLFYPEYKNVTYSFQGWFIVISFCFFVCIF